MAETIVDPILAAILIAILGLALWIVTNWHLHRGVQRVRVDIETKRKATEEFVQAEVSRMGAYVETQMKSFGDKIAGDLGGFEARVHAEIPPNPQGDIEAVKAEVLAKVDTLGAYVESQMAAFAEAFNTLPERVRSSVMGVHSGQERALRGQVEDMAEEYMEIAEGELAPYMDEGDAFATETMKWVRKPVDAEYEAKNPLGAGFLRVLKGTIGKEVAPMIQYRRRGRPGETGRSDGFAPVK